MTTLIGVLVETIQNWGNSVQYDYSVPRIEQRRWHDESRYLPCRVSTGETKLTTMEVMRFFLLQKSTVMEASYDKDGTLPDPERTTNPDFKCVAVQQEFCFY